VAPVSIPRVAGLLILCLSGAAFGRSRAALPVYIEDSHAGTFYWIVQNLPLDGEYQLLLIDAHSDASEIFNSDAIRRAVLENASDGTLEQLAETWRSKGVIQCFNWMEPLIPKPIVKVWWAPAESLTAGQIARRRREIARFIDAHEMAWPRDEGDFARRVQVVGLNRLVKRKFDSPVVVSVDLDFFAAETSEAGIHSRVARLLDSVLKIPRLAALTFSISRPYLASKTQADILLYEVLRYLARVVNADIQYEPFLGTGPDRSEKAKEIHAKGMEVPRYDIETAPPFLRSFVLQNASRINSNAGKARWERLLERWRSDARVPRVVLTVDGRTARRDEDHLIPAGTLFRLRIENASSLAGLRIQWKVVAPAHEEYNLTGARHGFADDAPKYLLYRDAPIAAADGSAEIDGGSLVPFLDSKTGLGTLRVYCEVSDGKEAYVSNIVQFSRYKGDGYVGKLTEIFNLPYVYGSALIRAGDKIGADARYGADCAHFIVYGRRREGGTTPYLNPKQLLPYLEQLDEVREVRQGIAYGARGPIAVTPDLLKKGLLLHFGKHIAAIYADDEHRGVLCGQTLVVHQLEGFPEITTFGAMAAKYKQIRVMMFK
jgi:hypothetical protein